MEFIGTSFCAWSDGADSLGVGHYLPSWRPSSAPCNPQDSPPDLQQPLKVIDNPG